MVMIDDAFLPIIPALRKSVPSLKSIVYIGESGDSPDGCDAAYESLIAGVEEATPATQHQADDVYGLFYTGGTTGRSKGVMLTHANIMSNATAMANALGYRPKHRYLHAAPMFHAADGASTFAVTLAGATHCFISKFEPLATLQAVQDRAITHTLLVPTMFAMIVQLPNAKDFDLSTCQRFLYGASPMPSKVLQAAMALFPTVGFIQGYGMTECSPVNTLLGEEEHLDINNPRLKSVGKAVPHAELKIVDTEGNEVARGSVGELCARGPHVMKGYYNMPDRTAEALKGGWMHTGDGAMMDEDGFVYIKDRIKDMIVTGGENVYSAEVEDVVSKCDGVAMCAVIGIPDDSLVEKVCAIVVPKADSGLTSDQVMEFCKENLAGYKRPREIVLRTEALPLSGAGKVLKAQLRKPFWENSERSDIYSSQQDDGAH